MFILDDKKEIRITIAKDVIKHLESQRIIAMVGSWVYGIGDLKLENVQFSEVLPKKNCKACALGSMFIAAIDRYNECKVSDVMSGDVLYFNESKEQRGFSMYMERYFEKDQLQLIEMAFEAAEGDSKDLYEDYTDRDRDFKWYGYTKYPDDLNSQEQRVTAYEFGIEYDELDHRLEAIMENIIKNDGEFCPLES